MRCFPNCHVILTCLCVSVPLVLHIDSAMSNNVSVVSFTVELPFFLTVYIIRTCRNQIIWGVHYSYYIKCDQNMKPVLKKWDGNKQRSTEQYTELELEGQLEHKPYINKR